MIKTNEKSNTLFQINKIIFKKYKILNLISEGVFGGIYLVINEKTNEYFAMKIEKRDSRFRLLEQEGYNLFSVKGLGIPELISFGRISNYNILIEEFLGKSLNQMFIESNFKFSLKDICLLSIQLLDRIELIHSKTLIHRDIKPENFLIGYKNPNIIYLTEFGLCAKYCSSKSGKHILPGFRGTFTGTLRYSSANAQRGNQQSRRDDLESLGYSILFFMKGKLPWMNLESIINEKELYLKTYSMKKFITVDRLCKGLPPEMSEYFKYVKTLKFQEEPNYDYLRSLFIGLLKKYGFEDYESLTFSWVVPSKYNKSKNNKRKVTSPFGRLYLKNKNQMESNKGNSQIEYSHTNNNHKINRNKTFQSFSPDNDTPLLNISNKIVNTPSNNINKPNNFMENPNLNKEHKNIKNENGFLPSKVESEYYYKINNELNNNKRLNEGKIPNIPKKMNNYTKIENITKPIKIPNQKKNKININTYNKNYNSVNNNELIHLKSNTIMSTPKNLNNNNLNSISNNNARNYLNSIDKYKLNNQQNKNMLLKNELLDISYRPMERNLQGKNFYIYKENFMKMNNSEQKMQNSSFNNKKLYNSTNQY